MQDGAVAERVLHEKRLQPSSTQSSARTFNRRHLTKAQQADLHRRRSKAIIDQVDECAQVADTSRANWVAEGRVQDRRGRRCQQHGVSEASVERAIAKADGSEAGARSKRGGGVCDDQAARREAARAHEWARADRTHEALDEAVAILDSYLHTARQVEHARRCAASGMALSMRERTRRCAQRLNL